MKFTKIILIPLFLFILSSLVFGGISQTKDMGNKYKVTYTEISIKKGWNLLPSSSGSAWDVADGPGLTKIGAIYLYLPIQNKYVSAMGGFNDKDFNDVKQNSDFLMTSASWYYFSEDAVSLSFNVDKEIKTKLNKGWNLLTIPPSFTTFRNPSLKNFPIGDCDVEKLYLWDSQSQKWENVVTGQSASNAVDELGDPDAIGIGVAIKVKSTCSLGESVSAISPPPSLPG